jgi:hypothetical protein
MIKNPLPLPSCKKGNEEDLANICSEGSKHRGKARG